MNAAARSFGLGKSLYIYAINFFTLKNKIMKRILILFSLMSFFAIAGMQAQKACCSSKAKSAASCTDKASATKTASADIEMTAAKLASLDENIDRKVCPETGKVTYLKKEVCEKSGKVSVVNVEYDSDLGQFVNISPSELHGKQANCSGSKTASAKTASAKSCCSGKEKASCCSKSASADNSKGLEKAKVKVVKASSGTK